MDVKAKIEIAVDHILANTKTIIAANQKIGIPLEECLCNAIRKALQNYEQNPKK